MSELEEPRKQDDVVRDIVVTLHDKMLRDYLLDNDPPGRHDTCTETMREVIVKELNELSTADQMLLIHWDKDDILEECFERCTVEEVLGQVDVDVGVDLLIEKHHSEYQQDTIKRILDYADEIRPYLVTKY